MSVIIVHRYYNSKTQDHLYTTDEKEGGTITPGHPGLHGYVCEGPGFTVFSHPHGGLVPVYRYFHPDHHNNFYTTNGDEIGVVEARRTGKNGYTCQGILGYISPQPFPGSVPVHRYYQDQIHDHLYTVDVNEIGTLEVGHVNRNGYRYEGVLGHAYPAEHHILPVFRYNHPGIHDHFYTTSSTEIGTTTYGQKGNNGYISEGHSFNIFTHHHMGLVPVFRYYHGTAQDHFYTVNSEEVGTKDTGKTGPNGYSCEGVMGYCSPTEFFGGVPVYRYYNGKTQDHFYTTNPAEVGTTKVGAIGAHGLAFEGILGYVPTQ